MTAAAVAQHAQGSIEAQRVITGLRDEIISVHDAWLVFTALAARYGWSSDGCRAFVVELAKRAGQ